MSSFLAGELCEAISHVCSAVPWNRFDASLAPDSVSHCTGTSSMQGVGRGSSMIGLVLRLHLVAENETTLQQLVASFPGLPRLNWRRPGNEGCSVYECMYLASFPLPRPFPERPGNEASMCNSLNCMSVCIRD